MHRELSLIGRVTKVHPAGTYRAPPNAAAVTVEVVELESGDALAWSPALQPIGEQCAAFFARSSSEVSAVFRSLARDAVALGLTPAEALLVLQAVSAQQSRALGVRTP